MTSMFERISLPRQKDPLSKIGAILKAAPNGLQHPGGEPSNNKFISNLIPRINKQLEEMMELHNDLSVDPNNDDLKQECQDLLNALKENLEKLREHLNDYKKHKYTALLSDCKNLESFIASLNKLHGTVSSKWERLSKPSLCFTTPSAADTNDLDKDRILHSFDLRGNPSMIMNPVTHQPFEGITQETFLKAVRAYREQGYKLKVKEQRWPKKISVYTFPSSFAKGTFLHILAEVQEQEKQQKQGNVVVREAKQSNKETAKTPNDSIVRSSSLSPGR